MGKYRTLRKKISEFSKNLLGDEFHYLFECIYFNSERRWYIDKFYFVRPNVIKFNKSSRKLLRIKVTPDLHLTYSRNGGKVGLAIENEKYSLYLNFIDKTCKIYLFIFVSICFIQYCSI